MVKSLDLLIQNQKLIEGLLVNIQNMNTNAIMQEQGLTTIQGPDVGRNDPELLQLRQKMLDANSLDL